MARRPSGPIAAVPRAFAAAPDAFLGAVTLLLPARRRCWGRAMRSGLAAVERPSARWRLALSCTRVALADPAVARNLSLGAVLTGLVVASLWLTADVEDRPVRAVCLGLVAATALIMLAGRRDPTPLRSPVAAPIGPVANAVRGGTYLVVDVFLLVLISGQASGSGAAGRVGGARNGGLAASWVATSAVALLILAVLLGLLSTTGRRARTPDLRETPEMPLALAAGCAVASGVGWFGYVLIAAPADPASVSVMALLVVGVSAVSASVVTATALVASGAGLFRTGIRAGLVSALLSALLVAAAPLTAFYIAPSTVPDPTPGSYAPQLSQADHDAQDASESGDAYIPVLLLAGLLGAGLAGLGGPFPGPATRRPRRPLRANDQFSDEASNRVQVCEIDGWVQYSGA